MSEANDFDYPDLPEIIETVIRSACRLALEPGLRHADYEGTSVQLRDALLSCSSPLAMQNHLLFVRNQVHQAKNHLSQGPASLSGPRIFSNADNY